MANRMVLKSVSSPFTKLNFFRLICNNALANTIFTLSSTRLLTIHGLVTLSSLAMLRIGLPSLTSLLKVLSFSAPASNFPEATASPTLSWRPR